MSALRASAADLVPVLPIDTAFATVVPAGPAATATTREPASAPSSLRLRGGFSIGTGFIGAGIDLLDGQLLSLTLGVGLGGPAAAITVGRRAGPGGPFASVAVMVGAFEPDVAANSALAVTAGWEWRFAEAWAIRVGAGVNVFGYPVKLVGGMLPWPDLSIAYAL